MALSGAGRPCTLTDTPFRSLSSVPRIGDLTGLRRAALETRRVQLRAAPANAVTHSGADRGLATPVALPTPPSAKGFPARQVNTAALAATLNQAAGNSQSLQCIDRRHILPDGRCLELLEAKPADMAQQSTHPPLLFVHGANHAAWCWKENFLPWFALHGHHVLAVSFRGHGSSSDFAGGEDKYHQSVEDLAHVISSLPQAPVLVAHSMGGFFAQRYLIEHACKKDIQVAGVVMLASASLTACMPNAQWWRSQKSIFHAIKCIWWMITSGTMQNKSGDREMLFSPDLPEDLMQRYFDKLHSKQTSVPVSFNELQAFLPQVASAKDAAKNIGFPIAVMIAGDDSLIMRHQVQATADYFGVKPVVLPGLAHDVMLDTRWSTAAQALEDWLQSQFSSVNPGSTVREEPLSSSE